MTTKVCYPARAPPANAVRILAIDATAGIPRILAIVNNIL